MQAWEHFLSQLETELGKDTVQKWLRSLKVLRFDACNLYLEAKDSFQALWFDEHIKSRTQTSLYNGNHKQIKVHLSLANSPAKPAKKGASTKTVKETGLAPFQLTFDELDPLCLFEHYVVNEENQLTFQLLNEIAGISHKSKITFETFNPIFLYGTAGSGKTHLMMSLAQAFRNKGRKVLFVRAETFTDHVVTAIRAGAMSTFRQAYRNTDVLIVDDIHVFSRKGATQEEFFHTFNTLHLEGKQIILSAHSAPQELQLIEPRLISRFEWGIVLPLKPMKETDLKALLKAKGEALHAPLPPKVAEFLVETFTSNPKALIKAYEALVLRMHLDAHHSVMA